MNKPIASLGLTNTAALLTWDINDEYIVASLNYGTKRAYKLYYNTKGAYFNYKGIRYYLGEFIRVGAV